MVDYFLQQSAASGCDVTVAVTPLSTILTMFPGTRRTAIKLKGGPYCGSNMFTFMTQKSDILADFWRGVEQERKNPQKVIAKVLGITASLQYLLGTLTLERAFERISKKVGVKIGAVVMPFAEAAVDVDSINDHTLVEAILARRDLQ
jgi:hypothetical protein